MFIAQNGLCAICQVSPATAVDHAHACCAGATSCGDCVRGLVCTRCNILTGFIETIPDIVEMAQAYLARWSSGLGRLPFKQENIGSNPIRATN